MKKPAAQHGFTSARKMGQMASGAVRGLHNFKLQVLNFEFYQHMHRLMIDKQRSVPLVFSSSLNIPAPCAFYLKPPSDEEIKPPFSFDLLQDFLY